MENTLFLNQHNFLITTGMTLFFIYLRTELNYLSNNIIVVLWLWFTRYVGGRPKFDFKMSLTPK